MEEYVYKLDWLGCENFECLSEFKYMTSFF